MTITYYDAMMLLIVIVAVIQGAWRGMVWQIAPIASLVLGYIVAYPMSERTAHYFGQPPTNRLFAMITIYLAVSLAVYLMVRSVRESLERLKLVELLQRHDCATLDLTDDEMAKLHVRHLYQHGPVRKCRLNRRHGAEIFAR